MSPRSHQDCAAASTGGSGAGGGDGGATGRPGAIGDRTVLGSGARVKSTRPEPLEVCSAPWLSLVEWMAQIVSVMPPRLIARSLLSDAAVGRRKVHVVTPMVSLPDSSSTFCVSPVLGAA
eukprot:1892151-Pyramimonas_sp.AAC.1